MKFIKPGQRLTAYKIIISCSRAKVAESCVLPKEFNTAEIPLLPLEGTETPDFIKHLRNFALESIFRTR